MEDLKQLQQKLKEIEGQDISIKFEGSLRLVLNIHNMQYIVTNTILLISNSQLIRNEEIEILTDEIISIDIKKEIKIEMNGNYTISIST